MSPARLALLAALAAPSLWAATARAATIEVGPHRPITSPAAAIASAAEGDIIAIDAGDYFECLRPRVPGLTIEGRGTGAVFTDTTCDGKAIIVVQADRLTLRNLTLQRARVADGNGAGIRAEGKRLTLQHLRFINNQAGLITTHEPAADITITDTLFTDTGRCTSERCSAAIHAGAIRRLRLERTEISGVAGGPAITSAAAATQIINSRIEDSAQTGASFQLLIPSGGSVLLEGNTLRKSPHAASLRAAILLDGSITGPVTLRRNRYINDTGHAVPFVLDWSSATPRLEDNILPPGETALSSNGITVHRAIGLARDAHGAAWRAAGAAKRGAVDFYRAIWP